MDLRNASNVSLKSWNIRKCLFISLIWKSIPVASSSIGKTILAPVAMWLRLANVVFASSAILNVFERIKIEIPVNKAKDLKNQN